MAILSKVCYIVLKIHFNTYLFKIPRIGSIKQNQAYTWYTLLSHLKYVSTVL